MLTCPDFIEGPHYGPLIHGCGGSSVEALISPNALSTLTHSKAAPKSSLKILGQLNGDPQRNQNHPSAGWCWGHLLNAELGGINVNKNLTPLTQTGNGNSANQKHKTHEAMIKNFLKVGALCDEAADPVYWLCMKYKVEVLRSSVTNPGTVTQRRKSTGVRLPTRGIQVSYCPMLVDRTTGQLFHLRRPLDVPKISTLIREICLPVSAIESRKWLKKVLQTSSYWATDKPILNF